MTGEQYRIAGVLLWVVTWWLNHRLNRPSGGMDDPENLGVPGPVN